MSEMSEAYGPFLHSTGLTHNTWVHGDMAAALHRAAVEVFSGASPYATTRQVYASGDYTRLHRGLSVEAPAYPDASPTVTLLDNPNETDPYFYGFFRQSPEGADYTALVLHPIDATQSRVCGDHFTTTPEGPAGRILEPMAVVGEALAVRNLLQAGIDNTSGLAPRLPWSEILGREACAFQMLVETALAAAGVEPGHLDYALAGRPKDVVYGEWELATLFVAPAKFADKRMPGRCINAYALLESAQAISSQTLYAPDGWSEVLRMSHAHLDTGGPVFRPAAERAELHAALAQQLDPGNLDFEHMRKEA